MKKFILNPLAIVISLMILAPTVYAATPPLGAVVRGLIARITTIETDVNTLQSEMNTAQGDIDTLETDVNTLQTDLTSLADQVTTIETELDATITDIEFYYPNDSEPRILKTDGTAWWYMNASLGWQADSDHDSPIDVDEIVTWTPFSILDVNGDTWLYAGSGSYTNVSAP